MWTPKHPDKNTVAPHPALRLGHRQVPRFKNQELRLRNALRIIANVIATEGPEYLAIFERIEKELHRFEVKHCALERALALSSGSLGLKNNLEENDGHNVSQNGIHAKARGCDNNGDS